MTTFERAPYQNDGRPVVFACPCGRSFLALPPLNPLCDPSFWDGDHVVAYCPDCGTSLQWALRHGASPGPVNHQPNTVGNSEGKLGLAAPGEAVASPPSSAGPAGEASNLPAGLQGAEIEWTFTRFPDGRVVLEVPECE